jgi:hypothetical protein
MEEGSVFAFSFAGQRWDVESVFAFSYAGRGWDVEEEEWNVGILECWKNGMLE